MQDTTAPSRPDTAVELCPGSHEYGDRYGEREIICRSCGARVQKEAGGIFTGQATVGVGVGHMRYVQTTSAMPAPPAP
jgi:hypothetical protein